MRFSAVGFLLSALTLYAQTPVILISVDTLRADHSRTPTIESWATKGGTRFANISTQVPLTLPAHTVLMASQYPFETGVEENATTVPPNTPTLVRILKGLGYRTAAFIGSIFLEKELGLDQGFDTYDSPFSFGAFSKLSGELLMAGGARNSYSVRERRTAPLVFRSANAWLAAHKGEPVFVFIHLFDQHKPWRAPTYRAQSDLVDQALAGLEQSLRREGWWDRSLVVLTADHGEGLGDHGESDHGYFIYESTVHVPLVVHWPAGTSAAPPNATRPGGLVDVAPSILDFLKIPIPPSFHGRSLFSGPGPSAVFAESVYARDAFGWSPLRSLRVGNLKYIDAPKPELYDLEKDPGEKDNLIARRPSDAARLKAQLASYRPPAKVSTPPGGDPGRRKEVLESLGYLAPGPANSAASGADPKDRLPDLIRYEEALDKMAARRYDLAIASFRAILAHDPGNLLVRRDLGAALVETRKFADAASELQRVASASPGDYVTRYELGLANEGTGKFAEAKEQFEAACKLTPASTQCQEAIRRVSAKIPAKMH